MAGILVGLKFASWNQISDWLGQLQSLKQAA